MEVTTTVRLLMFEIQKLSMTRSIAVKIYNIIEKIGEDDKIQDAHQLANSLVQLMDDINDLKAELPKLMELFNNVEKIEKFVRETPEMEYKD